jgi:hypothetical protein
VNAQAAFDFDTAEAAARRDLGATRAEEHADRVVEEWSDRAYAALVDFATKAGVPFLIETARAAAELAGVPKPPDGRAWGAVVLKASRAGVIRVVGLARASSSNNAHKPLWTHCR